MLSRLTFLQCIKVIDISAGKSSWAHKSPQDWIRSGDNSWDIATGPPPQNNAPTADTVGKRSKFDPVGGSCLTSITVDGGKTKLELRSEHEHNGRTSACYPRVGEGNP